MSEIQTVYAVTGSKGKYSDWSTWLVCWYPTREEADTHAAKLNAMCASAREKMPSWEDWEAREAFEKQLSEDLKAMGEDCGIGYDWPSYDVTEIPRGVWGTA